MAEPTNHELSERLSVLEEKMKTLQSDLQGTLERFRADMADWKTDMANWKTDMANRDKENQRWQIGLWVAAIVILGFIIRFPG